MRMSAVSHGRRGRKPLDPWMIISAILSGVFMTIGVFLVLMSLTEILVYVIDSIKNGSESYQGWWSTPLLMLLVSIPFFLGYLIVNLNRFRLYHVVKGKISINMPKREERGGKRMEKIELD